jgi:hypothetical protein
MQDKKKNEERKNKRKKERKKKRDEELHDACNSPLAHRSRTLNIQIQYSPATKRNAMSNRQRENPLRAYHLHK